MASFAGSVFVSRHAQKLDGQPGRYRCERDHQPSLCLDRSDATAKADQLVKGTGARSKKQIPYDVHATST